MNINQIDLQKSLFLDDIRDPKDAFNYTKNTIYLLNDWDIVRTYDEFVNYIQSNGIPDVVSFDHDISIEHYADTSIISIQYDSHKEKTGYHCAKWLIDYCIDNNLQLPKTILVHSMNPVGKQNILSLFHSYNKSNL